MKKLFIAPLAALLFAGSARAADLQTLTLRETPQSERSGFAQLVEVQTRRSPAAVIAQDALYGGIAGLAIGAGVALLSNDGNWGRDLAVGAGAGLIIGGIFGAVDAASMSDRAPVGFNNAYHVMNQRF